MGRTGEDQEGSLDKHHIISSGDGYWAVSASEYQRILSQVAIGEALKSTDFVSFVDIFGASVSIKVGSIKHLAITTKESRRLGNIYSHNRSQEEDEFDKQWKLTHPEMPD